MLLVHKIKYLESCRVGIKQEELFYSYSYQKEISRRLEFCAKRTQHLFRSGNKKNEDLWTYIPLFSLGGCSAGIGVTILIFQALTGNDVNYLELVLLFIVFPNLFGGCIYSGQIVENEVNHILQAVLQLNWYDFNRSNKRTYLIMVTRLNQLFGIRFSQSVRINYNLGLLICRGIYSVFSIMWRMYGFV